MLRIRLCREVMVLLVAFEFLFVVAVHAEDAILEPPPGTELVPSEELDGLKLKLFNNKFVISAPSAEYRWVRTINRTPRACYMCLNLKTESEAFSLFYSPKVNTEKFDEQFVKSFLDNVKKDLNERDGDLTDVVVQASDIPLKGKSYRATYAIKMPGREQRKRTVYYTAIENCLIYFQGNGPESDGFKSFVTSFNSSK